ncbi:hypothetical protein H9P43_003543 [Blastocladiella emersonii ATCC 22665]|nr:hypothetical protein H9P43_003543 [Blastocladiella emersonii ATCC 22665]
MDSPKPPTSAVADPVAPARAITDHAVLSASLPAPPAVMRAEVVKALDNLHRTVTAFRKSYAKRAPLVATILATPRGPGAAGPPLLVHARSVELSFSRRHLFPVHFAAALASWFWFASLLPLPAPAAAAGSSSTAPLRPAAAVDDAWISVKPDPAQTVGLAADIMVRDASGWTVLHFAVLADVQEWTRFAATYPADAHSRYVPRFTQRALAAVPAPHRHGLLHAKTNDLDRLTALDLAVIFDCLPVVRHLLGFKSLVAAGPPPHHAVYYAQSREMLGLLLACPTIADAVKPFTWLAHLQAPPAAAPDMLARWIDRGALDGLDHPEVVAVYLSRLSRRAKSDDPDEARAAAAMSIQILTATSTALCAAAAAAPPAAVPASNIPTPPPVSQPSSPTSPQAQEGQQQRPPPEAGSALAPTTKSPRLRLRLPPAAPEPAPTVAPAPTSPPPAAHAHAHPHAYAALSPDTPAPLAIFACPVPACVGRTWIYTTFMQHLYGHCHPPYNDQPLNCAQCGTRFPDISAFLAHVANQHFAARCVVCNINLDSAAEAAAHANAHASAMVLAPAHAPAHAHGGVQSPPRAHAPAHAQAHGGAPPPPHPHTHAHAPSPRLNPTVPDAAPAPSAGAAAQPNNVRFPVPLTRQATLFAALDACHAELATLDSAMEHYRNQPALHVAQADEHERMVQRWKTYHHTLANQAELLKESMTSLNESQMEILRDAIRASARAVENIIDTGLERTAQARAAQAAAAAQQAAAQAAAAAPSSPPPLQPPADPPRQQQRASSSAVEVIVVDSDDEDDEVEAMDQDAPPAVTAPVVAEEDSNSDDEIVVIERPNQHRRPNRRYD